VLARLWRQTGDPSAAPKSLPPNAVAYPIPKLLPPTTAPDPCHKRRQKRVRVCRLYPESPSEPLIHARALLALVQVECPQYVGGYVPRPDLEGCYRELCEREGWKPRHWTAIARQLGEITSKKTVRHRGERFVGYRIPRPSTYGAPKRRSKQTSVVRNLDVSDCFEIGSAGRIRTYDQPVNSRWLYH
jgi:hypothetical protein